MEATTRLWTRLRASRIRAGKAETAGDRHGRLFKLISAGPLFFVSPWLLMIFAGIEGADIGVMPFGYLTSMVVTVGLWLVLAPAVGAVARVGRAKKRALNVHWFSAAG